MFLSKRLPQKTIVTTPTILHPARPATRGEIIQFNAHQKSLFERSDTAKKQAALNWETVVLAVDRIKGFRGSANEAVRLLLNRAEDGDLEPHVANALSAVAVGKDKKPGRLPTRSTIFEKLKAYKDDGLDGLIKEHKGRIRQEGGWEGLALELYSQPSKPDISAVHMKLVGTHKQKCSVDQVRAYLRALPATLGQMSPARIGRDLYKQTQAKYIERCTANLLPGDIYMADGYRADVYLSHPLTGKIWRPEIMHIIDLRSRVLVGYRIMMHEGSYDVMIGWAECFARWDHVPPLLYVDNGSGYKNKLTEIEETSYYFRAGVQQVIHSIPHNPKGKGHVERFHRSVKDRFLKLWKPEFYCGTDMADEVLNRVVREVKAKRLTLPSLAEFITDYEAWIDEYNHGPHPEEKSKTRWEIWAELQKIHPHATARQIARPSETRTVQKASVLLNNRRYRSAELHQWNRLEVKVEYDILADKEVVIRTVKGELICTAVCVEKIGIVGESFMDDKRTKALAAAVGRKEKDIAEIKARAGLLIDAEAVAVGGMEALEGEAKLLPNSSGDTFSLDDFND